VGVTISLIVGDDGSTDNSLSVVSKWSDQFDSLKIHQSSRIGFTQNFLSLIKSVNDGVAYVALADQDDTWEEKYLINSIQELDSLGNYPALTLCPRKFFGEIDSEFISPTYLPTFQSICFKNVTGTSNLVMNMNSVKLLSRGDIPIQSAILIDWWILIAIYACGEIRFRTTSEVNYRIHANNTIGLKKYPKNGFRYGFKSGQYLPYYQIIQLLKFYEGDMLMDRRIFLDNFIASRSKVSIKLKEFLLSRNMIKEKRIAEVKFRIGMVFLKFATRNIK
jgi:glycosyltransferase involved in cell wall biosynthesis